MRNPTFYLVCYDIVDTNRRNRVSKLLQGYGLRVQKSVFECVLTEAQSDLINRKLIKYIDPNEDQVRFYPMTAHTRRKVMTFGMQPERQIDDVAFIV